MPVVSADIEPLTFVFEDDGLVPNNPMPFLVYKQAISVDNEHPEKTIEGLFGANGWAEMGRNGVYDYLHYHATPHEGLGVPPPPPPFRLRAAPGTQSTFAP